MDYPGSTLYTAQELDDLRNGKLSIIDKQCLVNAELICYVADTLCVPPISPDRTSGGIALVGWSHGGAVALWTLFNPSIILPSRRSTLEKFLKTIILYGDIYLSYIYFLKILTPTELPYRCTGSIHGVYFAEDKSCGR